MKLIPLILLAIVVVGCQLAIKDARPDRDTASQTVVIEKPSRVIVNP